jgi:hypothetical protein
LACCNSVSDVRLVIQYIVMREGACYTSIVVLRCEARCSSSSCSLDSSIRREVRLYRQVARRIDVPTSSGYVYRSRNWKIYHIHWIRWCIVKDRAKQSSMNWLMNNMDTIINEWHNLRLNYCIS